jgi:tRNA pseudouridine38-40 synthase
VTEPEAAPIPEGAEAERTTRFRLRIAYDGSGFHGWTRQPGLRTVQGVLEDALGMLLRRHPPVVSLVVAGRTDAGVHALGQVAHLDLTPDQVGSLSRERRGRTSVSPGERLAARLNGILGLSSDVVVTGADVAPTGFDARFGAVWRRYEYRIADTPETRSPLDRHRTVWHPAALDAQAMNAAARAMLGLHDFAAYCKPRAEATTIRTLQDYEWHRDGSGVLVARVRADAFCHSMVRALVGAAVAVGEGRLSVERPRELLQAASRSSEFVVMPARGLTLVEVGYPRDAELAARAAQTRARRRAEEAAAVVAPPTIG